MPVELNTFEILWVFILAIYAFSVVFLTKYLYEHLRARGVKQNVVIYLNRKLIHIFAGGVVVLAVPFVFTSPWYPLLCGLLMTVVTLIAHRTGKIFFWFQTDEDLNDVSFCIMWAVAIFVLWTILGNPWVAVIPPALIAFGDGITGIVRNFAFKERRKHPIGNIYMAGVSIPIGYYFGSLSGIEGMEFWGVLAAILASIFERYEFGPIDDNILITVIATSILFLGSYIGPVM